MTPSNDPNGKPFIYRIADALGITHLVVAVQHSHLMSEITGLIDALATKANAADVNTALAGKMDTKTIDSTPSNNADHLISSKGVKDALANKHDLVGQTISLVINGQEIEIESADVPNLIRALSDPDSIPTASSNNLVTSGGVKAALDAKNSISQVDENDNQEAHLLAIAEDDDIYFAFRLKNGNTTKEVLMTMPKMDNFARAISNPDSTPTINSTNLVTSGGVASVIEDSTTLAYYSAQSASNKPLINDLFGDRPVNRVDVAVINSTGEGATLSDLFRVSSGQTLLEADNATSVPNGSTALVHIYKVSNGYFLLESHSTYTLE